MRRGRREGDRVPRLEDELIEADDDSERARQDVPELVAVMTHERVVRAGCAPRLIGGLEELDVLVGPEHEPFPSDA